MRRPLGYNASIMLIAAIAVAAAAQTPRVALGWSQHCGNAQHSAYTRVPLQNMDGIVWSTPLDLNPRYSGNDLLSHYGSPCITAANNVVVPVKLEIDSGFRVDTLRGSTGTLLWSAASDYVMPPHSWTPSFGPCLLPISASKSIQTAAWPMIAGRVAFRDANAASAPTTVKTFYGQAAYSTNPAAYDDAIRICTPLTCGPDGSVYFGFLATADTPIHLKSGIARITPAGIGSWAAATELANDPAIVQVKMNGAPAVTTDGSALYVVCSAGSFGRGFLVKVDTATMQPLARVALKDPKSLDDALIDDQGTACPTIGPDGDVFVGALENPFPSNHDRGWMLHYSSDLSQTKIPGAFGWDDSASIVPASLVSSYAGGSSYLIVTKYNDYAGVGATGANKIGLLDPFHSSIEPISGIPTMAEVATVVGVTPDQEFLPEHPLAVREWCVNTAAVEANSKSVLLNSEDGVIYRWDLTTLTLTEQIRLTAGIGEAYTSTLFGPDGKMYGISNARLYAIGSLPHQ